MASQKHWLILKAFESTEFNLIPPLKDEVQSLRLKVMFLRAILCITGKWDIEDGNLKTVLTRFHSVLYNEHLEFFWLYKALYANISKRYQSMPMNFDSLISCMLQKIDNSKPEIQEVYALLSKSSRSITVLTDKDVIELLGYLTENLEDLFSCKADLVVPVKEELETVEKGLRFLRDFLCFTANRCSKIGKLKDLRIHAEVVAVNTACLLYLCSINNKMDDQMINWMKLELLSQAQKIRPQLPEVRKKYIYAFRASKSSEGNSPLLDEFTLGFLNLLEDILELSESNLSLMISVKDQMLALHEELSFLKSYVMDPQWKEFTGDYPDIVTLVKAINTLIYEFGFLIYNDVEDMARDINSAVSHLLAKVEDAKEDARKLHDRIFPKSLRIDFPRTNTHGFTSFLFENLKELVKSKAELVAPWKHHIEEVRKDLQSLREDFDGVAKQPCQHEELKDLWSCLKDVAHWTEYIIDLSVSGAGPLCLIKLSLFQVIQEIKTIRTQLKHINTKITKTDSPKDIVMLSSKEGADGKKNPTSNIKLVLFDDEVETIKDHLMRSSRKLQILSIVGMPGIGKTTLADSVFQHSSIINHFHVHARCCVSQQFDKKRVLLEILHQVTGETHRYNDDLDHKLYQSLSGRRYIIFLDDIWEFEPLEQMKDSFPDDGNGSRIMLTSRFTRIASQAEPYSNIYHLSPLSIDKSWEMLRVKLFGEDSYPLQLEKVGRKIAGNCKGIPLTIDLIAGILRVTERKEDRWQEVAESLMKQVVEDPQGQCRVALELSYHHLPDHLKACFLYYAAFPADKVIGTSKLISWWIAEGFVQLQEDDQRSLEDEAEAYLNDLIDRSFIMISKIGRLGEGKATRVHDLLHEFALAKSKEESFLLQIDRSDASRASSSKCYRLCIYPDYWDSFCKNAIYGPHVRSLICSADRSLQGYKFDGISYNYKLLRVLDLANIWMCECSPSIFNMVHLRSLVLRAVEFTTSGIHLLRNLETLVLYVYKFGAVPLSVEHFCGMVKLRQLHYVDLHGEPRLWLENPSQKFFQMFHLDNLQSISCLTMTSGEDAEKIMKQMPNLRMLECRFMMNSQGSAENRNLFPKLDFLEKLQSLNLDCFGLGGGTDLSCYDIKFYFPPYLKMLTLKQVQLPWTKISALGNMQHLEVLKLKKDAFVGPTWNMIDGQFPKLKYLLLRDLDITEWNASEDDLPCLERLYVSSCPNLKGLPACLNDSMTIQEIGLKDGCNKYVVSSAFKIRFDQKANGNTHFLLTGSGKAQVLEEKLMETSGPRDVSGLVSVDYYFAL